MKGFPSVFEIVLISEQNFRKNLNMNTWPWGKQFQKKINDIREFMVINDNNDEASRKFALIIKLCYYSWYVEVSSIILIFPS